MTPSEIKKRLHENFYLPCRPDGTCLAGCVFACGDYFVSCIGTLSDSEIGSEFFLSADLCNDDSDESDVAVEIAFVDPKLGVVILKPKEAPKGRHPQPFQLCKTAQNGTAFTLDFDEGGELLRGEAAFRGKESFDFAWEGGENHLGEGWPIVNDKCEVLGVALPSFYAPQRYTGCPFLWNVIPRDFK